MIQENDRSDFGVEFSIETGVGKLAAGKLLFDFIFHSLLFPHFFPRYKSDICIKI